MASPRPPSLGPAIGTAQSAASALSSAIPSGADVGEFIKEQRQGAKLSLRRLAEEAGVSNPYLSQIERGLRRPSAEILQQLAKALRISAEQLYVQAGLLEDRGTSQAVEAALVSDDTINERQKRVLLDIYASFHAENEATAAAAARLSPSWRLPRPPRRPAKKTAKKTDQEDHQEGREEDHQEDHQEDHKKTTASTRTTAPRSAS